MLFDPESIPLAFHAFPDVVQDPSFSQLESGELLSRIVTHQRAILDLEEKIKWHRKAIAQYHGCLNVVEPRINVLMPRELLREIFKHLMWSSIPPILLTCSSSKPLQFGCYPSRNSWLKVALVCRYWRSIALSFNELFSYVHIGAPRDTDIVSKFLEYSQPSPLYVSVTNIDIVKSMTLDIIIPHIDRILAIQIDEIGKRSLGKWPIFHATKTLVCNFADNTTTKRMKNFLARFPNLERLYLTAETIIPSVPLPSLTYLTLSSCKFSQQEFSRMLRSLPKLKILELDGVYMIPSRTSSPSPTISLERLVMLPVDSGSIVYAPILEALLTPKILQIGPSDYSRLLHTDLDCIYTAIKLRCTHTLDLTCDGDFLKIESRRIRDNTTSDDFLSNPDETRNPTNISPKGASFNVDTLTIHSMPHVHVYQRPVFALLHTLSSLKIKTIRIPHQLMTRARPLHTGYNCLRSLHISTDNGFCLPHLQWIKKFIQTRQRNKQSDLELLCLESSHSSSLWGDEGPDKVSDRDAIVDFLRLSVGELRVLEEGRIGTSC